ncbi:glycosyltransferase [Ramlibacter henchirensis]|uniref:Glycosyltransferase n=1 Tax=Ramlibacter henchirensis TaxID=204072 RepID=A0A4Z0C518_9BURK|nr:glycosyltransferase [Ramlibacter henchirensis]
MQPRLRSMTSFFSSPKREFGRLVGRARSAPALQPRPVQPNANPVDVIVPVYRGLADTRLCIDSVLASPVCTPYRLVVINDASPDPEITAWLRERAAADRRIVLLENSENLGFVGTVNRGMALNPSSDVVLLNSDTEVANDWLDRMRAAAYGDARVASVTPLSTNATICSYPRFCRDNRMPAGYTTARLDGLCARTNPGLVIDVPTGVGFCMYIRRDCLQEIGLFDTENFGKGYGEENDFCQRAAAAGWRNLHLLDTFVLHTGGVSFGVSKRPREEAAMQTMRRLHPNYEGDILAFIRADPARPARLAMDVARITECGLPVVLAVTHDRSGGTMRHVGELAKHLADQAIFLVLTPASGRRVLLRLAGDAEEFELAFRLPDQYERLCDVLRALGVRHVHFHHLIGHDPSIRDLPRVLGLAYDFTAHDYYSYCTWISLTGRRDRYVGELAAGQCRCCPPDMAAPGGAGTVAQWRAANAELLRGARHVFVPSHDAARRISGFAPGARVVVVGHTDIPPDADLPQPQPAVRAQHAPLRVVVVGALSRIKGADVLEATAHEAARRRAPIEFHVLGHVYRPLRSRPSAYLTVHGKYEEEDLAQLLAKLDPDLAWFPAQSPETYCYTLSAVLKAGLPVVVPDLGAFPERVQGRAWSWIRPWNSSPTQWLDDFIAIHHRHFMPGIAPALPERQSCCQDSPPQQRVAWSYGRDYLLNLGAAAGRHAPLRAADLEPFLFRRRMTPRLRLLAVLDYVRTRPVLSSVAQSVPTRWRQRVSDWLSA